MSLSSSLHLHCSPDERIRKLAAAISWKNLAAEGACSPHRVGSRCMNMKFISKQNWFPGAFSQSSTSNVHHSKANTPCTSTNYWGQMWALGTCDDVSCPLSGPCRHSRLRLPVAGVVLGLGQRPDWCQRCHQPWPPGGCLQRDVQGGRLSLNGPSQRLCGESFYRRNSAACCPQ